MDRNHNFFNVNPIQSTKQNTFANGGHLLEESSSSKPRLNGYDINILNDKTLPQGDNEKLKIEYKISEKQQALTDLNWKIKNAELYGTQNEVLSLRVKKQRLEQELFELNKENASKNSITKTMEIPWIRKTKNFVSRNVLAKISKKFSSIVFLGDSLEKLSEINKSVDELIEMNVPYGEKKENYEKLTQYLYQANQIHSQITKTINKK